MQSILRYFTDLRDLVLDPRSFFETVFGKVSSQRGVDADAVWFTRATGVLFAVLFFLQELFLGGRLSWIVVLVAILGLIILPFLAEAAAALAAWILGMVARLLGEYPDTSVVRRTTAYASAGLLPLATGLPFVSWLSLSTVFFLMAGLERGLKCSRFKAALLAGFPSSLLLTVLLLSVFIFKIQVF